MVPTKIPDHELVRCIGRGSYGEVWLARNVMGAWRAVKIVWREHFGSARPYEREFDGIRKFEPVSRTHESQLDILHVGRDDDAGYFYYVMELADDVARGREVEPESYTPRTLRSEMEEHGRLSARRCLDLGIALATALEHLHSHGLIHRDVKPANVIFINGRPKLADIGLVAGLDETMSFVGTEGYVPPEGPGSERGDLFALGKVLYEIHTGLDRAVFPDQPTALLPGDEPSLARELNLIVLKACAPDAERRQPSLTALREEMEILKTGRSVERLWRAEEERHEAVERERVARVRLRRWGVAGAAAAAVLMLAGWAWQQHRTAERERALATRARDNLGEMLDLNTNELREKLESLGKLSLLTAVNEKVAAAFDPHEKEPLFLALQAAFLKNHSRVLAALGHGVRAIHAAEQAIALLERLRAGDPRDARWTHELAETKALLAEYLSAHGEHALARDAAEAGLMRLANTDEPLLRAQLRRRLGEAQAGLRDRPAALGTLAGAVEEMKARTQAIPADTPTRAALRHELALAHESLGHVRLDLAQGEPALASFRASAAVLDELAAVPAWKLDRVRVEAGLADSLAAVGDADGALAAYRRSHQIASDLADSDRENALWKRERALSGSVLAKALRLRAEPGRSDEALALLAESERELKHITELDPSIEAWQWDLAGTVLETGHCYSSAGQPTEALPHYLHALGLMDLFAANPDTPADRLYGLGTILVHSWRAYHAQPALREAENAHLNDWRARAHARAPANPAWYFVSAVCDHVLGENARTDGNLDTALAAHRSGFGEMTALFSKASREQRPSTDFGWRERHAGFCVELARNLRTADRAPDAREFAGEALRKIFETGDYPAPDPEPKELAQLKELAAGRD